MNKYIYIYLYREFNCRWRFHYMGAKFAHYYLVGEGKFNLTPNSIKLDRLYKTLCLQSTAKPTNSCFSQNIPHPLVCFSGKKIDF